MRTALATFYPVTEDRLRFTRQLGITDGLLWGTTLPEISGLDFKKLLDIRGRFEGHGLRLFAIETLPTQFMRPIILGGDERDAHLQILKRIVRDMGRAGIAVLGYNWMVDGVWRTSNDFPLRGGARGTLVDAAALAHAPETHGRRYTEEEVWSNFERFLDEVLPIAVEEGVTLALHPNDAPVAEVAGVPALFSNKEAFDRALSYRDTPFNALCLCLGNWGAMGEDLPSVVREYGTRQRIAYVHFQAVQGSIPADGRFNECFVDEADNDALEIMKALHAVEFSGVMIPGHVPQMEGDSEWRTAESSTFTPYSHPMGGHRARAYTIGYLQGLIKAVRAFS